LVYGFIYERAIYVEDDAPAAIGSSLRSSCPWRILASQNRSQPKVENKPSCYQCRNMITKTFLLHPRKSEAKTSYQSVIFYTTTSRNLPLASQIISTLQVKSLEGISSYQRPFLEQNCHLITKRLATSIIPVLPKLNSQTPNPNSLMKRIIELSPSCNCCSHSMKENATNIFSPHL